MLATRRPRHLPAPLPAGRGEKVRLQEEVGKRAAPGVPLDSVAWEWELAVGCCSSGFGFPGQSATHAELPRCHDGNLFECEPIHRSAKGQSRQARASHTTVLWQSEEQVVQPREPSGVGAPGWPHPPSHMLDVLETLVTRGRHAPQTTDHRPIEHQPSRTSEPVQPHSSQLNEELAAPYDCKRCWRQRARPGVAVGGALRTAASEQPRTPQTSSCPGSHCHARRDWKRVAPRVALVESQRHHRSKRAHSCMLRAVSAVRSCQDD